MRDFSDKVMHYALNPRHAGLLADANAVGEAGSLDHGQALRLMLRVAPGSETIEAARFLTFGGSAAIAASEALSRLVIGKTLAEASRLTGQDITTALEGEPERQGPGSALGAQALAAAIAGFRGEASPPAPPASALVAGDPPPPRHLARNAPPPAAQALARRAAGGAPPAGFPFPRALTPLPELAAEPAAEPAAAPENAAPGPASGAETAQIAAIIDEMRPVFQRDGGDIALVAVEGAQVFVRLSGACAGCMMASHTLGALRSRLVAALGRAFRVIPAPAHAPAPVSAA